MKKSIFILTLFTAMLVSCMAFAKCADAPDMAKSPDGDVVKRCENKEAICYLFGGEVSCFKK